MYWFLAGLLITATFCILLFHKPSGYEPSRASKSNRRQVSRYLTHKLMPQLYNGAQYQEPFKLIATEAGINDVIADVRWLENPDNIKIGLLKAFFQPGRIVLMGTVFVNRLEFVVTVVIEPGIDKKGMLHLPVTSVKLGAVNIGLFARAFAKKAYSQHAAEDVDSEHLQTKIAAALLDGQPFEPVFEVDDKKIKMKRIAVKDKKVVIDFVPHFHL